MPEVNAQQFTLPGMGEPPDHYLNRSSDWPYLGQPPKGYLRKQVDIQEEENKPWRGNFWKSNPNQMALPSMEEHAHPGAHLLTQGYTFETRNPTSSNHATHLKVYHPENDQYLTDAGKWAQPTGYLNWTLKRHQDRIHKDYHEPGEIGMIEVKGNSQGRGIASTMIKVASEMTAVPPESSAHRTEYGEALANSRTMQDYAAKKGKVIQENSGRHLVGHPNYDGDS